MKRTSRRIVLMQTATALGGAALVQFLPGARAWGRLAATPLVPLSSTLATRSAVLDTMDPLATFILEGGQSFIGSPTVLSMNDASVSDILNLYAADSGAMPGGAIDIFAAFQIRSTSPCKADSGVHFVINDGQEKAVIAACVTVNGVRGIGVATGTAFCEPSNYAVFVEADWTRPLTLRLRRTAQGDGEIVEVNGVAPQPRALVASALLAPRNRVGPTVEFGCTSPESLANVEITEFYAELPDVAIRGGLAFTEFRMRDDGSGDRLRVRADFNMGAGSNGIDPRAERVFLRLSTSTAGQFYPSPSADFNPLSGFGVHGRGPRRRWSLTDAERARTGIERFDVDENPKHTGSIILRDVNTALPNIDYSTVNVEIEIGDDLLIGRVELVEPRQGSGRWSLDV